MQICMNDALEHLSEPQSCRSNTSAVSSVAFYREGAPRCSYRSTLCGSNRDRLYVLYGVSPALQITMFAWTMSKQRFA